MAMVTIKINNRTLQCQEGDTIVDVAREHGIFIPTICYLGGCSPTLACKMCMGETKDGKRVYTCNTKAKDGLEIFTDTPEIRRERQMIMQTYDVNHPLECGVCDKSGECELQNLTLYTKVAHQEYALIDDEKHEKSWAQALYDPNLCIVCERCVTTCKDNIGEAKLKAGKADLHAPDAYKDSMPKDPYSVWSKKQKSLIDFVSDTPCVDCGECIAVCPVGALTYKDFSYTANAWELQKIPSTCTHCAMGCHIVQEIRHSDTLGTKRVYRVTNDFQFAPICGAARFGFSVFSAVDEASSIEGNARAGVLGAGGFAESSAPAIVQKALDALSNAKALRLGSDASNEEAMLASLLAARYNLAIYNEEARAYQQFLSYLRLNHTLKDLKNSSTIISLGCAFRLQAPGIQYAINNTIRIKKGIKLFYMHPIADALISSFSRSVKHIAYAPNNEEIALGALLLSMQEIIIKALETNANKPSLSSLSGLSGAQNAESSLKDLLESLLKEIKNSEYQEGGNVEKSQVDSGEKVDSGEFETPPAPPKIGYKALESANISLDDLKDLSSIDLSEASIIVGADVLQSVLQERALKMSESENATSPIIAGLALLEKCGAKVFVIPNGSNVAGIARICALEAESSAGAKIDSSNLDSNDLDSDNKRAIIGIRADGDVKWGGYWSDESGALVAKPDFILPAPQQMRATMTNAENRVLPLEQALAYGGYDLASIAHYALSDEVDSSVDSRTLATLRYFANFTLLSEYTRALPRMRGFSPRAHESLPNYYTQGGDDVRGYALDSLIEPNALSNATPRALKATKSTPYNAYVSYPQNLFGELTILDKNMQQKDGIYTSKAQLERLQLKEGQEVALRKVDFALDSGVDSRAQNAESKLDSSMDSALDSGASNTPKSTKASALQIKAKVYIDYGLGDDIWLISPNIAKSWRGLYHLVEVDSSMLANAESKSQDSKAQDSSAFKSIAESRVQDSSAPANLAESRLAESKAKESSTLGDNHG